MTAADQPSSSAPEFSKASPQRPEVFVDRLLDTVTLPRVTVRAAECILLSQVDLPRPILDVGSGDGTFAACFFKEPVDVGLDPWRQQILYSRQFQIYKLILQASGDQMPFPDASFSTVMSNSTLEHTEDPAAIIRDMARVAKPGATCIVTVPSEHFPEYLLGSTVLSKIGFDGAAKKYGDFLNRISRHVHIQPPDVWRGWLEDAGFEVVSWRYYFSRLNTMVLDLGHYLSAPSIVTHKLLGRWVLWPEKKRYLPYKQALSPFAGPGRADEGAYIFFHARKPS